MADLKKLRSDAKGKFAALTTIVEKKDGLKNLTKKLFFSLLAGGFFYAPPHRPNP
jgi:hypothetical protein